LLTITHDIKGNSNTTSTSKIKKTKAIKKNRSEIGPRADDLGINPHSNGLFCSVSILTSLAKIIPAYATKILIINIKKNIKKSCITNIIYNSAL